jgi:hypothetical protein
MKSPQLICVGLIFALCGCAGHFRPRTGFYSGEANRAEPSVAAPAVPTNVTHLAFPKPTLNHKLTERAFDGNFPIHAKEPPVKVDAHSILELDFPTLSSADIIGNADPQWKPILELLRFFREAAVRFEEINSRKPRNPAERKQLQQDAAAAAANAANLTRQLLREPNLGLDQDQIADIVLGEHPSLAGFPKSTNGYVNLGRWLTVKLQERADALKALATNQQVKVSVQAFRESNGARAALHIPEWDTFAEGAYQPIDKTGLRPTEAEQARLNAERQQAEGAKQLVESLTAKNSALKQGLKTKLKDVEQRLAAVVDQLKASITEWSPDRFLAVSNTLQALAAQNPQGPPARLLADIRLFGADFAQAKAMADSAVAFVDSLRNINRLSPDELLFNGTALFAQAGSIFQNLTNFAARLPSIPERITRIQQNLPAVADAALQQQLQQLLQPLTQVAQSLGENFAEETQFVASLWSAAFGSLQIAQGAAAIKKPEGDWVPRTLDNLVPARLDLRRSAVALGDLVSLRVAVTNEATGETLPAVSYETEVGLMGFHGKPAVHFMLARALSGPSQATQWKPNIAAAVEWHYTIRRPQGFWGKTWNWLYPGAGIHLASLDQGSDSVELGAGGVISLWDGLLTGGYGYNFSNNADHQYVFVGVNLLTLLQQGKKQFLRGN